ncbi:PqqD family protein [Cetobacterium sp. SF1]|uniref:PqqD family protein n=1 Tax=unclassified Cetobacterium TaxID=2630983 RepID=UPI003CF851A3
MNREVFLQYKPVYLHEDFYVENDRVILVFKFNNKVSKFLEWLVKKPKRKYIHLDELGTYFWLNCNKNKSIEEIINEMANAFKDPVSSMEDRIFKYANYLAQKKLIAFV